MDIDELFKALSDFIGDKLPDDATFIFAMTEGDNVHVSGTMDAETVTSVCTQIIQKAGFVQIKIVRQMPTTNPKEN